MKLLGALLALTVAVNADHGNAPTRAETQLWAAIGDFGHSLLNRLITRSDPGQNVLLSPLSVHSALSMVLAGATSQTREEMLRTMNLKGFRSEDIKNAFSALTSRKHENITYPGKSFSDPQFIMRLANRVYAQKRYPFAQEYLDIVRRTFHADAVNVDFARNGEGVKNAINGFVKDATNGLIKEILQKPLDHDTVMVIINALYFKGDWKNRMTEKYSPRIFNAGCDNRQQEQTSWIGVTTMLPYLESTALDAKVVRIPYESVDFSTSMLIIMPNKDAHDSCTSQQWLQGLQWNTVRQEINRMEKANVELIMPQFEMDYRIELQDVLAEMNMRQVFQKGEATLGRMLSDQRERLNVDQVIHETKMIVTKYGTEAAAATALSVTRLAHFETRDPIKMTVDRTFYVAILYGKPGVQEVLPLFSGIVRKV